MRNKRFEVASLLILVALLFIATACTGGVRVGDMQTKSQMIELDDADSVNVGIHMGAGELDITGGADELLEATFTYNVEELNPQVDYDNGRLEVTESDVDEGIGSLFDLDEYHNEWDLIFTDRVPMEMSIDLGAGRSNLALGALSLTDLSIDGGAGAIDLDLSGSQSLGRLDFDMGAGEVSIDLTGKWQNDLDARLRGGLGEINVTLPSEVGVIIDVDTGVGRVNARDLNRDQNTYTNDAYGSSDVTLRIEIDGGVGNINLDVE